MDIGHDEYDRILFFELARKNAEAAYAINPLDADNITRWGRSLIDCVKMLEDGVLRLEEALQVEPGDTLWCLGNAHTSHAFYIQDQATAKIYFDKSTQCFQQAVEADPRNEMYHKSLDLSSKPLAWMGASVTGIDAVEKNIKIARIHAGSDPLTSSIEYYCTTADKDLWTHAALKD